MKTRKAIVWGLIWLVSSSLAAQEVVRFPRDFEKGWSSYIGKEVQFDQILYITGLTSKTGEYKVSDLRWKAPEELYHPTSEEFISYSSSLEGAFIKLQDPNQKSFLRAGTQIDRLTGVVTAAGVVTVKAGSSNSYNPHIRPVTPPDIGDYTLKICGFNLQYYCPNWQGGLGAASDAEFEWQHDKILQSLLTIDADIYALCEIQEGQVAAASLVEALNNALQSDIYSYVEDQDRSVSTYTKVAYLYKKTKVAPYREIRSADPNNRSSYRKRLYVQSFDELASGERFVLSMNHFRSKSNSADMGESIRMQNATNLVDYLAQSQLSYHQDPDVLIMGDLNAYSMEAPIRLLVDRGYENQTARFCPEGYSYTFNSLLGYLDHAMANSSMSSQITGVAPYHINTDENYAFGYKYMSDNTLFRCSDHDPIIVGLALRSQSAIYKEIIDSDLSIYHNSEGLVIHSSDNALSRVRLYGIGGAVVYDQTTDSKSLTIPWAGRGVWIVQVGDHYSRLVVQ